MGVRAGQGYGVPKPKRLTCPDCKKHGVTQWRATGAGLVRYCQFCQASWGEAGWDAANGKVDHITHPFNVEAWVHSSSMSGRMSLIGRAMFKTEDEAKHYVSGTELRVRLSRPGDVEFA